MPWMGSMAVLTTVPTPNPFMAAVIAPFPAYSPECAVLTAPPATCIIWNTFIVGETSLNEDQAGEIPVASSKLSMNASAAVFVSTRVPALAQTPEVTTPPLELLELDELVPAVDEVVPELEELAPELDEPEPELDEFALKPD